MGTPAAAVAAAMAQTARWRDALPPGLPVGTVFATPLLRAVDGGWAPMPGTLAAECCPLAPRARGGGDRPGKPWRRAPPCAMILPTREK